MTAANSPRIGVIGASPIASALREMGYDVITGSSLTESARAVSGALASGRFPVLSDLAYSDQIGFDLYLSALVPQVDVLVIVPSGGNPVDVPGAEIAPLPVTVNGLLPMLGLSASAHPAGFTTIGGVTPQVALDVRPEAASAPAPVAPTSAQDQTPDSTRDLTTSPVFDESEFERLFADTGVTASAARQAVPAPHTAAGQMAPALTTADMGVVGETVRSARQERSYLDEVFGESVADQAVQQPDPMLADVEPDRPLPPAPLPRPVEVELAEDLQVSEPAIRIDHQPYFPAMPAEAEASEVEFAPAPRPELDLPPAPAPMAPERPTPVSQSPIHQHAVAPALVDPISRPARPQHQDLDGLFARAATVAHGSPQSSAALCPMIFVIAPKGGVAKTATTINLAKLAAEHGLRVVVVDANQGQGDVGARMRIPEGEFPSVLDAAISGDPDIAIVKPAEYNARRMLSPLGFAVVQAPPKDQAADPRITAAVYAAIIRRARESADLVVVDTQVFDALRDELFDRLVIPELVSGAWAVTLITEDFTAAANLDWALGYLRDSNVDPSRNLVVASRWSHFDDESVAQVQRKYAGLGRYVGHVEDDPIYRDNANLGEFRTDSPGIAPTIKAVLHQVTGRPEFAPAAQRSRRQWPFGRGRR